MVKKKKTRLLKMSCRVSPKRGKCPNKTQKYKTRSGKFCCRRSPRKQSSNQRIRSRRSRRKSKSRKNRDEYFPTTVQPFIPALQQQPISAFSSQPSSLGSIISSPIVVNQSIYDREPLDLLDSAFPLPMLGHSGLDSKHAVPTANVNNFDLGQTLLPKPEDQLGPVGPVGPEGQSNRPADISKSLLSVVAVMQQPSLLLDRGQGQVEDVKFGQATQGQLERFNSSPANLITDAEGQLIPRPPSTFVEMSMMPVTKTDIQDAKLQSAAVTSDAKQDIKQIDLVAKQINAVLIDEAKAKELSNAYFQRLTPSILAASEPWIPAILKVMRDNNIEQNQKIQSIFDNPNVWYHYIVNSTVNYYSSFGYIEINKLLISSIQGNDDLDGNKLFNFARALLFRELIIKNTYDIDLSVWRWSNQEQNDTYDSKSFSNINLYNKIDNVTQSTPFQSTSLSKNYAYAFARQNLVDSGSVLRVEENGQVSVCCMENIIIPKGTQCLYTGGLNNSEFEIVFPPCTEFVVQQTRLKSSRASGVVAVPPAGNVVTLVPKPKKHKSLSDETIAWLLLYLFSIFYPFGTDKAKRDANRGLINSKMREIYQTQFITLCR